MRRYLDFALHNSRLLSFGALMTFSSSFGQTFFISLFAVEIRDEFNLSDGAFGFVYSLGTLLSAGLLLFTGPLIDRVDLRKYTAFVTLGLGSACLLLGVSGTSIVALTLAFLLLRQFGQALHGHTAMTTMGRYFDANRGKAVSLASLGFPVGEAFLPIIAVALAAVFGWRGAWVAFSIFIVFIVTPLAFILLSGRALRTEQPNSEAEDTPSPLTAATANTTKTALATQARDNSTDNEGNEAVPSWTRAEMLRDPRLYILLPAILAPSFIFTGLFFHQVFILVEGKDWSRTALAASYTLYAGTVVLTKLGTGVFIDRFSAVRALPYFLPPQVAAILVLLIGDAEWLLWPYMILTGISVGITHSMLGALTPEIYGKRYLGGLRSAYVAAMVFSSAASPVAMGVLFDLGWSFTSVALLLIAYGIVGIGLSIFARNLYLEPRHPPL